MRVQDALKSKRIPSKIKNEFMRSICFSIGNYTMRPKRKERLAVARKIIKEYPFMEGGIVSIP
jgi:hypothetical protein